MAKKSKIAKNEQRKVIVERYAEKRLALKKALVDPVYVENMTKLGAIPVEDERASPQGLSKKLNDQINTWTPIIQKADVYLQ